MNKELKLILENQESIIVALAEIEKIQKCTGAFEKLCCQHKKTIELLQEGSNPSEDALQKLPPTAITSTPESEEVCECGHKQWEEHKSSFYNYRGLKMVAQECNVKGCKCKKFRPKRKEENFKDV